MTLYTTIPTDRYVTSSTIDWSGPYRRWSNSSYTPTSSATITAEEYPSETSNNWKVTYTVPVIKYTTTFIYSEYVGTGTGGNTIYTDKPVLYSPYIISGTSWSLTDYEEETSEAREIREKIMAKSLAKSRLRSNWHTCFVKSRAQDLVHPQLSEPELKAMGTLREMISELEFRKYLKYGFVVVKGRGGDTYQVLKNNSHVKVWRSGRIVEEVCVRIRDVAVPPTDRVIAMKAIIEASEEEFKKLGNVYKMAQAA